LLALPLRYADFSCWQQGWLARGEQQQQLHYWTEHLRGAPKLLELPTDTPRPPTQSYRGATVHLRIDSALMGNLRALARRSNVTLAMALYTAWTIVLARLSGQGDIVLGMPVANRRRAELEGLVGLFVNTLAVRIRVEDDPAITNLLARVKEMMLAAYGHQDTPFEQVVEALQPTRSLSYSPIFQVMFVVQPASRCQVQLRDLELSEQEVSLHTAQFDLALSLQESAEGIAGTLNYATDLFASSTIERWAAHFLTVLDCIADDQSLKVSQVSMMSDVERTRVLQEFNATSAPYPVEKLIHELFEEQVERTPHEVAVSNGEKHLTYRQLNCRANQLARYLRAKGAGPDRFVGLFVERGVEMVVGMLGILKAGGGYVPLDPNYPLSRVEYMLQDTAPVAVLTQSKLRELLPAGQLAIELDGQWNEIAESTATNLGEEVAGITSSNLAYVIYTSGSTGQPKGVAIEHRNAVNMIWWAQQVMSPEMFEVTLQSTSVNFDLSVYECFVPLTAGGGLRVVQNALSLVSEPAQVTLINTVPSAISGVLDSGSIPATTRVVNLAGEALRQELVERIFAHSAVEQVCNLYGPSETTTYSTWIAMPREEGFKATIGRPIANTQIYILDRHQQIVPIGVVGEIYIGGAGVARGYLNRPELTAERFLRDPFSADAQARMYRTGDLGRWRMDGTIEYLGRNDHQVKIRGFRVELGEIESRLRQSGQFKEVAVIAREDVPGDKQLVAYLVPSDPQQVPEIQQLREHLKTVLPEYVVPSAFVMLARLPLTPNGKLDRKALPAPELGAYVSRQYETPQGEVEEVLAGIWQSLLRVERVGRHDNFFELGGHSLLIVQMMERLRRVGLSTELRRVFDSATLADLANALTREVVGEYQVPPNLIPPGCEAITPQMLPLVQLEAQHIERIARAVPGGAANIQDIYPLAPLQEGILFHHLLDETRADTYVLSLALRVASRERLDDVIAALQGRIDRHDVLRTAVLWEDLPQPVQVVYRKATLSVEQVALVSRQDPAEQVKKWLNVECQRLDLRYAPLMRLQVAADVSTGSWYVALQWHHVVIDHVTLEILTTEVVEQLKGHAQRLPPSTLYREHVARALAYSDSHDEEFFRRKLSDLDEPTAPFQLYDVHGDTTKVQEAREQLDAGLARRARAQARRHGVSTATLFHAAWSLVVAHTSGRHDVVFGTLLSGRLLASAGAERALGLFINTLPLRLRLQSVTTQQLVEQTQRELVELLAHEQASLAVAQRCSGVAPSQPLFTVLFNYRHSTPEPDAEWSSAPGIEVLAGQERTNYPIALAVDDLREGFALTAQTDNRIDASRILSYLQTAVHSLVASLEQAPQTPALVLAILPEHERRAVLQRFNATESEYPRENLIHRLFEEQVKRTPTAVAIVHEGVSLTFAELNSRSNQLARYLIAAGVGPDQLVGICTERSLEMIVGMMGILKAGGAYVPLDPSYPPERLAHMITDAVPRAVLTHHHLNGWLSATSARLIALDTDWSAIGEQDDGNLEHSAELRAHHLAYVIYTSGSTGLPKGVMVEHRHVLNLWLSLEKMYGGLQKCSRIGWNASFNFDASVQQFVQLISGRTIFIIPQEIRRDIPLLLTFIEDNGIQGIDCTPSQLRAWMSAGLSDTGSQPLRTVLVGGEAVDLELWARMASTKHTQFINVYGPTECTVDSTAAYINGDGSSPHIGRPMQNRRVYILDARLNPAPIGVRGEIYIAGAGVARGYLNRPELTEDRFVQDPFEGGRMYRTGDLGAWRASGTIDYLGRNDHQVKIRGLRIELGEIEAQLLRHEQVKEAVVIAQDDSSGEARLIAYVMLCDSSVLHAATAVDSLRAHLRRILPEQVIPAAFVSMSSWPLTPSGKLNRAALPAPQAEAYASTIHEPPQGAVEMRLAQIWQEILPLHRVGRNDNFFESGGHSLLVLKLLGRTSESFNVALRVSDVYKNPILRDLAARLQGVCVDDRPIDLYREASLDNSILPIGRAATSSPKAILLSGATGFVGRFLLSQLLVDTEAVIYCLVRGKTQLDATQRMHQTLLRWDLWREEFEGRLVAIPADMRLPFLGMDPMTYRFVCEEVEIVYHCATSMNHLETYRMAKAANVEGAKELLRLVTRGRPKVVNYISTLSVFGQSQSAPNRVVTELSPIDSEVHLSSQGYTASKWVSDQIFLNARRRGIQCNIFRLGLVWADTQGRFDEAQHVYRVIKTSLLAGCGIEAYRYAMPPTPVDYVARSIVFLAQRHRSGGGIFHLSSSKQGIADVFSLCAEYSKIALDLVSHYEWITRIKQLHRAGSSLPAVPLVEYAFNMDRESFEASQRRSAAEQVRFDCLLTQRELERAGIDTPMLNEDLLRACVSDMLERDPELREEIAHRSSRLPFVGKMANAEPCRSDIRGVSR
jgi:amino acid adenylation domain-containing protein/thioester reductase-like protein